MVDISGGDLLGECLLCARRDVASWRPGEMSESWMRRGLVYIMMAWVLSFLLLSILQKTASSENICLAILHLCVNSHHLPTYIQLPYFQHHIMLYSLLALGLGAAVAEAAVARTYGCQLHLTASGAISGPVGEISSGQVRAGSGVSSTTFTLQGDQLWDDKGYGCWWTREFLFLLVPHIRVMHVSDMHMRV